MHRMTGLLLLLWAGATVSSMLDLQKRVIGGTDCKKDERKYHVKLVDANKRLMCGGSLISKEWILTAEHCNEQVKKAVVYPYGGEPREIAKREFFKDIRGTHDIMLLKLKDPVEDKDITPVNPPKCDKHLEKNTVVQLAGHMTGTFGPKGENVCHETPNLQCVDAPLIDCDPYMECLRKQFYDSYKEHHNQAIFCAAKTGVNFCEGDSGGGVVYKGMIYGVNKAFGVHGCTRPMLIMNVCGYKMWIKDITGLKY